MNERLRDSVWVAIAARAAALLALAVGVLAAVPRLVIDARVPASSHVLLSLVALSAQTNWLVRPVLTLAAVAVGATLARGGHFDGPAILLVIYAGSFALLPGSSWLYVGHSLTMDCVLLEGLAAPVLALAAIGLLPRDRATALVVSIVALLVVLEVSFVESVRWRLTSLAILSAVAHVTLTSWFAYGLMPLALWDTHAEGRAVWRIALAAVPVVLAVAVVLALAARQPSMAVLLGVILGLVLLASGAVLLSLRVRRTLEIDVTCEVTPAPEQVFEVLADLRNRPWSPPQERLEVVSAGAIGLGTRVRYPPNVSERHFTVCAFEPPRLFAWELEGPTHAHRIEYEVKATAGGSRIRALQRMGVPLYWSLRPGYLRRFREGKQRFAVGMDRLRRFLEAGTTPSSVS